VLVEIRGELVEIVGQLNLAAQCAEGFGDGAATLHCDQAGDRATGTLNDDLLAALGKLDQSRELALGFVHSNANHNRTILPLS
jgi:hypothetical protein